MSPRQRNRLLLLGLLAAGGLAIALFSETFWLWTQRGPVTERASLRDLRGASALAFSPDGRTLAVGIGPGVELVDVETYESRARLQGHSDAVVALAYAADGALASAGHDGAVLLWRSGASEPSLRLQPAGADSLRPSCLAFAPDGQTVAAGFEEPSSPHIGPGEVRLWDVRTGELRHALRGVSKGVSAVAFDPGGPQFCSGDRNGGILLWHATTGETAAVLQKGGGNIAGLAFRHGGRQVVAGGGWGVGVGIVRLWEVPAGRRVDHFERGSADARSVSSLATFLLSRNCGHFYCCLTFALFSLARPACAGIY